MRIILSSTWERCTYKSSSYTLIIIKRKDDVPLEYNTWITSEKDENRSENVYLECFQIQIVRIICKNIGSDMAAGKFVHNQL